MAVPDRVEGSGEPESHHQSPDDLVMGTNSSSIVSKRSVERLYYPEEPHFFRFFVSKFQRRAPLINRGYFLRLQVIDTLVRKFLEGPSTRKKVVVNLGCGSDVLPWQCHARYPELSQDVLFVDVDFPDLMAKKQKIVLSTPELRGFLGSFEVGDPESALLLRSDRYCQVGCDLRQLELLRETLATIVGGSTSDASFYFVAEVSITYLETIAADEVIQWASTLGDSKFCLLEQIIPDGQDHPFALTMLQHFEKLKTPLKSIFRYPTLASQNSRFQSRGWTSVQSWTLWEAWADETFMSSDERKRLDLVEPFDEWEELALFASHYLVLLADTGKSTASRVSDPGASTYPQVQAYPVSVDFKKSPPGRGQRRAGAAMVVDNAEGGSLVSHVSGQGTRARLTNCDLYQVDDHMSGLPTFRPGGPTARVYHTLTDLGALGVLLVGGRASPSTALKDCWLYRKVLNRWDRVQDLPVPLFRHSIIRLGSSSLALLAGGKTNHHTTSDGFYLYHPNKGWSSCQVQGSPPALFGSVFADMTDTSSGLFKGIMAGGICSDGVVNENVFRWKLHCAGAETAIVFQRHPGLTLETTTMANYLPLARFGASCVRQGERTLVLGGVAPGRQLPRELDMVMLGGTWQDLQVVGRLDGRDGGDGPLRPFLIGSAVVSHGDGRVNILGGGATCFSMGTYWSRGAYTLRTYPEQQRQKATIPTERSSIRYLKTTEIFPMQIAQGPQNGLSISPSTTEIKKIPRVRLGSVDEVRRMIDVGEPVIIEGADVGACVSRWTPDYLVDTIGADRKVSIHDSTTEAMDFVAKNFQYVNADFGKFMRDAQAGSKVYLRALSAAEPSKTAADLSTDFPRLADDFRLPPELDVVAGGNVHSSVLRISGRVNMWLHYDVMANVYAQVRGSKRLMLFHPRDVTQLGFRPGASSSSVDVFAALEEAAGGLGGVVAHEAEVGAGDVLFLPPLWLHAAKPTGDLSVAVNVFFRNLDAGYSGGRDVYGNRDLAAYEKGQQDVRKMAASFGKLPRDMAEFYIRRLADELLQSVAVD